MPEITKAQVQQITLNEAVSIALEKSIEIQQAANNLERSDAAVQSAYGQFLPNLNATMGANRTTGRQFNQATISFDDFTQNAISGNLGTSVPLFTGWQNISNLRQARTDREAAQTSFERQREDIIFNTASSFLQVILNLELLEIAKDNLETAKKQLEQVEAQVDVGMRPIVDQFNQEAEVANNELLVIQRQSQVNTSKVQLIRLLQLDALQDYEFIVPDISTEAIIPQHFELTELIEAALSNRKDIRAAELQIESAEFALRSARSGYLPTLSFSASISSSYGDQYRLRTPAPGGQGFVTETVGFSDQFFDQRINRGLGFNLSIPIFDRFQTRTAVTNRQIDLKNSRLALIDRQSLVFQEVRQAYEDYVALTQELATTEIALRAAEKAFETQQERYNVGSSTLIELTQANNAFFQASSQRVQTIYQFVFQEKLLDYFLGRITEDVTF
ncbi:TolC family protein [Cyclonatronum proteinivorum]|uniref:TolC family protein n=1 Tax=Cyclonatronum proteinivorum TaxID=1457365 RepID=UPI0013E0007E|nr:TolC family protein [Cyclonatronum proteinivorum]